MNPAKVNTVLDWLEKNPDRHNQEAWGLAILDPDKDPDKDTICGTTMCMAGATVHLAGYVLHFNLDEIYWENGLRRAGAVYCKAPDGTLHNIEVLAGELLELTEEEVSAFFFESNNLADLRIVRDQILDGTFRYGAAERSTS